MKNGSEGRASVKEGNQISLNDVYEFLKLPVWLAVIYVMIPGLILMYLWWESTNQETITVFIIEIGVLIILLGLVASLAEIQDLIARAQSVRFVLAMSPFYLSTIFALSVRSIQSPLMFLWDIIGRYTGLSTGSLDLSLLSVIVLFVFIIISLLFYGATQEFLASADQTPSARKTVIHDALVLGIGGLAFYGFHGLMFWFWDFRAGNPINITEGDRHTMVLILAFHIIFTILAGITIWLYRDALETVRREVVALCSVYYVPFLLSVPLFKADGPFFHRDSLVIISELTGSFVRDWDPVLFVLLLLIFVLFIQIVLHRLYY